MGSIWSNRFFHNPNGDTRLCLGWVCYMDPDSSAAGEVSLSCMFSYFLSNYFPRCHIFNEGGWKSSHHQCELRYVHLRTLERWFCGGGATVCCWGIPHRFAQGHWMGTHLLHTHFVKRRNMWYVWSWSGWGLLITAVTFSYRYVNPRSLAEHAKTVPTHSLQSSASSCPGVLPPDSVFGRSVCSSPFRRKNSSATCWSAAWSPSRVSKENFLPPDPPALPQGQPGRCWTSILLLTMAGLWQFSFGWQPFSKRNIFVIKASLI